MSNTTYLLSKDTLKTIAQGALGAMTFGAYHQFITNRMMELNNENLNSKHNQSINEMKNNQNQSINEMKNNHNQIINEIKNNHNQEMYKLKEQINNLERRRYWF